MYGLSGSSELEGAYGASDLLSENLLGKSDTYDLGVEGGSAGVGQLNGKWKGGKANAFPINIGFEQTINDDLTFVFNFSMFTVKHKWDYRTFSLDGGDTLEGLDSIAALVYDDQGLPPPYRVFGSVRSFGHPAVEVTEANKDIEFGLKITTIPQKLFITPRLGRRAQHFESAMGGISIPRAKASYNNASNQKYSLSQEEMFFESRSYAVDAKGLYLGADFQYYLTDELSLLYSYTKYLDVKGEGNFTNLAFSSGTLNIGGVLNSISADLIGIGSSKYSVKGARHILGVQYDITKNFHLQLAYQMERYDVSYPDYHTLLMTGGSSLNGVKLMGIYENAEGDSYSTIINPTYNKIGDRMAFGTANKRDRNSLTLGASLDFEFGK